MKKKLLGLIMDLFNPIIVNTYGANINRNTVENINKTGFTSLQISNLYSDIVKKIIICNVK